MDEMDYQMESGNLEGRSRSQNQRGHCPALTYGQSGQFSIPPSQDTNLRNREGYMGNHWGSEASRQPLPPIHQLYGDQQRPVFGSHSRQPRNRYTNPNDSTSAETLDPTAPVYNSPQRQSPIPSSPYQDNLRGSQRGERPNNGETTGPGQSTGGNTSSRLPNVRQGFDYMSDTHAQTLLPPGYHPPGSFTHMMALPPPSNGDFHPPNYYPSWAQDLPAPYSPSYSANRSFGLQNPSDPNSTGQRAPQSANGLPSSNGLFSSRNEVLDTQYMDAISAYARGDRDDSDLSSGESDEGSLDGLSQAMNLSNRGQTDRRGATTTSRTSFEELARDRAREVQRAHRRSQQIQASSKLVASPAAIASFEKVEKSSLDPDDHVCIICYNEFGVMNPDGNIECPVRLPKCKHMFGDHCLKQWLKDSDSCPYCRDKLDSTPKRTPSDLGPGRHHRYASALSYMNPDFPLDTQRQQPFMQQPQSDRERLRLSLHMPGEPRSSDGSSGRRDLAALEAAYSLERRSAERNANGDSATRHRRGRGSATRTLQHLGHQRSAQTQQYQANTSRQVGGQLQLLSTAYRSMSGYGNRNELAALEPLRPIEASTAVNGLNNTDGDTAPQARSITPFPTVVQSTTPSHNASTSVPRPSSLPSARSPLGQVFNNHPVQSSTTSPTAERSVAANSFWDTLTSVTPPPPQSDGLASSMQPSMNAATTSTNVWNSSPPQLSFGNFAPGSSSSGSSVSNAMFSVAQSAAYREDLGAGRFAQDSLERARNNLRRLNGLPSSTESDLPFYMQPQRQ